MPWPPTSETDFVYPLAEQLSSLDMPGLSAAETPGVKGEITALDGITGEIAPGVLTTQDSPFDVVEQLAAQRKAVKEAESLNDDGSVSNVREMVIKYASEKIGMPYVWGGESDSEGGYDCSGLLWMAFKRAGVDMPRISWSQAARGKRVDVSQLRPGDLVAWDHQRGDPGADHIALYIGDGWILEAPRTGLKIRKRRLRANEGAWGVQLNY
jgi:cell wall-associated NlpC family hydrolase